MNRQRALRIGLRIGLLLVAALLGLGLASLRKSYGEVTLEFEAEIERGAHMELFYNELWEHSIACSLEPGQRKVYEFHRLPGHLFALRLDPTNVAQSRIRIYNISLKRDGRVLYSYGPAQLRAWSKTQLEVVGAPRDDVFDVVSTDGDPILFLPGPWRLGPDTFLGRMLNTEIERQHFDRAVLVAVGALLLLRVGVRRGFLLLLVPGALALFLRIEGLLLQLGEPLLHGRLRSDLAVGWSNYTGYPKEAEFRVVMLAVLLTGLGGWLLGRWLKQRFPDAQVALPPSALESNRYVEIAALVALVFLMGLTLALRLPQFEPLMSWLHTARHSPGYDEQNFFTWRYCLFSGWKPLRDFWYPYGDLGNLDGFFASGGAREFLHRMLLHGTMTACVYVLSNRSKLFPALVLAAAITASNGTGEVGAESRYSMALDLVLLALVCRQLGWSRLPAITLGAFAGYCLVYEPHQILYASIALGSLWGLDFVWPRPWQNRAQLLSGLKVAGATFAICAVLRLLMLLFEGRLLGQIEFLRQSGPMVVYGALQADVVKWFRFELNEQSLLLLGMLFLIGYGALLRVYRSSDESWDRLGAICLSLGLLTAVVINKQVSRPHVAWQLLPYVALGGLFVAYRLAQSITIGAHAAALFGLCFVLGVYGGFDSWTRCLKLAGARLAGTPSLISGLADGDALEKTYKSFFFDEERYPAEQPVIRRLKELLSTWPQGAAADDRVPLYVFGDQPFLYAALKQKPPYYITFYNASPIEAQQRMVRWLEARRPEYVVWKPGEKGFDEVPHVVRVPLLFAAVISTYEPLERVGAFHILRRRPSDKPIDLAYFRETVGATLDLGALPAYSRLGRLSACRPPDRSPDRSCAEALHVHIDAPRPGERASLRLSEDGAANPEAQGFSLTFLQEKGVRDYYVPLERVWFYSASRKLAPEKKESFVAPPNATLEIVNLAGAANILY